MSTTRRTRAEQLQRFVAAVNGSVTRESIVRHAVRRGQAKAKAELLVAAGTCEACAVEMPHPSLYHIHHVVPVQRGGTNAADNTVLVCPNCHAIAHWLDRSLPEGERPTDRHELLARLTGDLAAQIAEEPQSSSWLTRKSA